MPKRKRSEPAGSLSPEPTADRSLARRKKLCTQRIAAAQKPLVAALRHAASLERQKHSRRKKTAQSKKDVKEVARIDAEYAHLKSMDLEKVAEQHLRKTIGKVKSLRENEAIPESVKQIEKGNDDERLLSVKSRLFRVDAVRKVVEQAIVDLKEIVGAGAAAVKVEATKDAVKGDKRKKAKIQEGEEEESPAEYAIYDSDAFAALDTLIAAPSSADEDSEASLSDGHRPPSIEDSESENEEGSEGDLSDDAKIVGGNGGALAFHDFSNDEESSDVSKSDTDEDSDVGSAFDSDEDIIPLSKTKRKALDPKTAADSKFLPTLSHAAYFSGSESEASDIETEIAPRKNRRGQKARQKIWEQKFKDKAKHLQKEDRSQGWDPKRGAVADGQGRYGGRGGKNGPPRGRGPEKSGANEQPLGPKKTKRDDTGTLHPSWQAAKAAKEKKLDMKPQGKKVVFD
ncbi:hypothetical protein N0V90_004542 [Kalmusia sp. IMI 367209]|nr:hypothetical protein N0V90_004542 [Kalmusia sp. IMI 367209]